MPNSELAHSVWPGDDTWDAARQAWNLAADQHPAAVAYAESAADVSRAVGFARERGLRVAPQGSGHGAIAIASLEDTVLLKTERMSVIEIDADRRLGRAEAGALWGDVAIRAGEVGLAALHGSSPDVGVVGSTLGGGIGWLSRSLGLSSNSVRAIELVTADGAERRVDADNEPELFWALRGGGGAFGVVTAMEFELFPIEQVYAGFVAWPVERAGDVAHAYREWAATVPEEMTSQLRFLNLPPFPELPEPLRGASLVDVLGAFIGDPADGEELLRPLRELADPVWDSWGTIPAAELRRIAMDPEQPVPGMGDHTLIGELTPEAADAFVQAGGPDSPLISLQLRQLGGALAREPEGAGALAKLDADHALYGVGALMAPEAGAAIAAHLAQIKETMAPFATGHTFLNFSDRTDDDVSGAFEPDTWRRLLAVKSDVDPEDFFVSNHPIPSG
ncbi:MAG TPA: FAD-binding oxidoreductase [Thermoleophilaceae bacterium]|nr:FAD-binding oxidoreductase [Thermoleophilaceae bacterium]